MKVILTDKMFQDAPDSSIHMAALVDEDLSPIPDFEKVLEKVFETFIDDAVSKPKLAAKIAAFISTTYSATGVLVIVGSSQSDSVAAAVMGEVIEDPDVKFEMYKLLGWDR